MVKLILIVGLFVVSHQVNAMQPTKGYVNDWWENVYEMRIKKENYEQIKKDTNSQCEKKIQWYEQKLNTKPKSEYYKYKLDTWNKKCN